MPTGVYPRKPRTEETKRKIAISMRIVLNLPEVQEKLSGENNHNWKGGTSDYTAEFYTYLSKDIKERDNYTCQECEAKPEGRKLHVHHRDNNSKNDRPSNLITLCAKCHRGHHPRKKKV